MNQKRVFIIIFAALAIMLLAMPFTLSINDVLTKGVEKFGWYVWIQDNVVPLQVRVLGVVIKPLGIDFVAYKDGFTANGIPAKFSWNCLGWQSMLLLLISLPFGFKSKHYTLISKTKALVIGILGIYLLNILRILFTVILLVVSQPLFAMVLHDYLMAIVTVAWLVFFWWFSYAYILEEKIEQ